MVSSAPLSRPVPSGYDRLTITYTWALNRLDPEKLGRAFGEAAWTMRVSNSGPSPIVRAGAALREIAPPRHLKLVR